MHVFFLSWLSGMEPPTAWTRLWKVAVAVAATTAFFRILLDFFPILMVLAVQINVHQNGDWQRGVEMTLTNQDCRRKEDLGAVICPQFSLDETCSLFTSWGTRITSCSDLKPHDSVFLVPANKLVVLPVRETKTDIQHISLPSYASGLLPPTSEHTSMNTIQMLTLSDRPRIVLFDNVATSQEAMTLRTYLESELPYYLQAHSSDVDEIDSVEVQGDTALALRKRLFDLLGVFPFDDGLAEPLVVMRINSSQALPVTRDYLERDDRRADLDADHDYEKSNRFLTVLVVLAKVRVISIYDCKRVRVCGTLSFFCC